MHNPIRIRIELKMTNMKKIVLLLSFIGFSLVTLNAQVELRRSDFSYPGASYQMSVDTAVQIDNSLLIKGDTHTWDFSQLDLNESRTVKFLEPTASNGGTNYPGCNLVIQEDDTDPTYSYIQASGDEMIMLSTNSDSFASQLSRHRMMIFPATYGDRWQDFNNADMRFTGDEFGIPFLDSVRLIIDVDIVNDVDGEGKLKLPAGEADALRVRFIVTIEFELEGKNGSLGWQTLQQESQQEKGWSFYGKESGYRMATIREKENGQDYSMDYRAQSLVSVQPVAPLSIKLYPNPVRNNTLQIESEEYLNLELMDAQGKIIQSAITISPLQKELNVSELPAGLYRLVGKSASGQIVQQSFIKQ